MEQEFMLEVSIENHIMFHVFWCSPQEVAQFFADHLLSEQTSITVKMAMELFEDMAARIATYTGAD